MLRKYFPKDIYRVATVLILLIAIVARILPGTRTIDDSFITYRYAQQLLEGHGLVYNMGERVLGTTTPLYAGLMAFLALFFGGADAPFPTISLFVNVLADVAACWLLIAIGRKLRVPLAGFAAALAWSILPYSVTFAIGGLETSIFILLLTALMYFHLEARRSLVALLAALSLLTRPDAALLLLPLGLDRLYMAVRKKDRITWSEVTAGVVPLLAWLIPAAIYYGSPLPNSIAAKTNAYILPDLAAFTRFLQHYATPFMDNLTFGSTGAFVGMLLYLFLSLTGSLRLVRSTPRAWPIVIFPWAWWIAYSIANPLIFRWYLTPPLPAYLLVIFAGSAFIHQDLTKRKALRWTRIPLAAVILFGPFWMLVNAWVIQPTHGNTAPAPDMAWIQLELKYQEAAEYIQPRIEQHTKTPTLAAADIGALGYYTSARILDTLGLISPEAIPYYPTRPEYYVNAYAVSPDLILHQQPDYIVLLEVYGREGLFKNPDFQQLYTLMHTVETDIYDSEGMLIFAKNPIPLR